jgi:histidine triad (HIT) family protein
MEEGQQCIFCKIANGEIPSYEVYSDNKCMAFLDINPATKGHVLLIPKEHFSLMPLIPDDLAAHLGQVAKHIAMKAMKTFDAIGVNIFVANGAVAGQNAPHVIIHIIPRYNGDDINLKLIKQKISPGEIQKIRNTILPKVEAEFGIKIDVNKTKEIKQEKVSVKKPNLDAISDILMKNG